MEFILNCKIETQEVHWDDQCLDCTFGNSRGPCKKYIDELVANGFPDCRNEPIEYIIDEVTEIKRYKGD